MRRIYRNFFFKSDFALIETFFVRHRYATVELNSIVQPYNSIKIESLLIDVMTRVVFKTIQSDVLEIMRKKIIINAC